MHVRGREQGQGFFAGVMKRHGFHGQRASHGSKVHRAPGSIGQSASPSRVLPGMKGPGRLGQDRVTVKKPRSRRSHRGRGSLVGQGPGSRGQWHVRGDRKKGIREEEKMPSVPMVDVGGRLARRESAQRRRVRCETQSPSAVRSGQALPRRTASRHPRHQDPRCRPWRGQEALATEGHRSCPRRIGAYAAMARGWHGFSAHNRATTATSSTAKSSEARSALLCRCACKKAHSRS